jgi:hypothetical protein
MAPPSTLAFRMRAPDAPDDFTVSTRANPRTAAAVSRARDGHVAVPDRHGPRAMAGGTTIPPFRSPAAGLPMVHRRQIPHP